MSHKDASTLSQIVVKYGGSAMDDAGETALARDVSALSARGYSVVIVHGGGPEIDAALAARNMATSRVDGLRITDSAVLEVAESVLCAGANKRLVRTLLRYGVAAVGLSGQDGAIIEARAAAPVRGTSLGYVGEITAINGALLKVLLNTGHVPVVAPLGVDVRSAQAYNVNADTAAGAIAAAVDADALIMLTDVPRVLRDPQDASTALDALNAADAAAFAATDACAGGMRPKITAAAQAVRSGVTRAYICAAGQGAIASALNGHATIIS